MVQAIQSSLEFQSALRRLYTFSLKFDASFHMSSLVENHKQMVGLASLFCSTYMQQDPAFPLWRGVTHNSVPGFGAHSDLAEWILQDEIDSTLWSHLFHSFTSVHSLNISAPLEPFIAAALQGLMEE
jgi:hypothetical protein